MEAKRRIVVFDRVTADGYFCDANGGLAWAVPDDELDREAMSGERPPMSTMLFGRRTYDMFESFWPRALEDPAGPSDPHHDQRRSPAIRKMAEVINAATKIVFSRTRKEVTWSGSRLVREFDPKLVEGLKREPGADVMIFGSGSIVSLLTEHRLVDEYQLIVNPVMLGGGRSLVSGLSKVAPLKLKDAKAYASGNVKLRYVPSSHS